MKYLHTVRSTILAAAAIAGMTLPLFANASILDDSNVTPEAALE